MENRCLNCMKLYDEEYDMCPHCGFVRGTKPNEVYHLYPGLVLADRYTIGVVLNAGGFGIVYKAWDAKLETTVAIKEFYQAGLLMRVPGEKDVHLYAEKNAAEYKNGKERFLEEARNTARFKDHPNIVDVFDYFEENGTAYYVMEYMDGQSLTKYLQSKGGKIDTEDAIKIMLHIMEALKEVHASGIIHRDVSPHNIMILNDGRVKLFDFGAGRFSNYETERDLTVVLKPGYAPHEQYHSNGKQGPWTDVYALAATMYRAITGVLPEESTNRLTEDLLKSPRELDPEIPEYIDADLMRAMSLEPKLRFQTVQEFETVIVEQRRVRTEKEELKRRRRNRVVGIATISIALLIAGVISLISYKRKEEAANLSEATITLWLPVTSEETRAIEEAGFENALAEFRETYPQVTVNIEYILTAQYEEKIYTANIEGNLPTVFITGGMESDLLNQADGLIDTYRLLNYGNYYELGKSQKLLGNDRQIPLGIDMPVLYVKKELLDADIEKCNNDKDRFISGDSVIYVGNVSEYREIQEALPGKYKVVSLNEKNMESNYTACFSVNKNADEEERNAGKRVLFYLLGENGQDGYFVQTGIGTPINKEKFQVYVEANKEFLFLKNDVRRIVIDEEDAFDNREYRLSIYNKLIENKAEIEDLISEEE